MFSGKTIFYGVLDWGIGHATRSVPLITSLSENNRVILGVTNLNRAFFESHFPDHLKIELPSYRITYSATVSVWLKILMQWPKIDSVIKAEKKVLEKIIGDQRIDVVISDNRFGLYHEKVHSVFITHQLKIKVPIFSVLANTINRKFIHRFNEVWVPDYENENLRLAGELSNSGQIKIPVTYIGPQSNLSKIASNAAAERYDYLILLSGVEPQRSILEKKLIEKFSGSDSKIVLVRGTEKKIDMMPKSICVHDFISGEKLSTIVVNSETVICRSGYSTLMDMHALKKKKLILIPTPGQTEQEYLASYWKEKFNCKIANQEKLDTELLVDDL